jgi:hypothetical protein
MDMRPVRLAKGAGSIMAADAIDSSGDAEGEAGGLRRGPIGLATRHGSENSTSNRIDHGSRLSPHGLNQLLC